MRVAGGWLDRGESGRCAGGDGGQSASNVAPALDSALLVAHAKGDPARAFRALFGFEPLGSETGWLYLPLWDVDATLSSAGLRPRGASHRS